MTGGGRSSVRSPTEVSPMTAATSLPPPRRPPTPPRPWVGSPPPAPHCSRRGGPTRPSTCCGTPSPPPSPARTTCWPAPTSTAATGTRRRTCWAGSSRTGRCGSRAGSASPSPRSATWTGRRRRSASPWSTASWRRATTRDPARPGGPLRRGGPAAAPRCGRGRSAGRGEPGRAAVRVGGPARRDSGRPSATRTSRGPTPSSRWPTCGPRRAGRTRPRGCTGGPCAGRAAGAQRVRHVPARGAGRRGGGGAGVPGGRPARRAGLAVPLGRFLVDDGRAAEARPYVAAAAALGDDEAVRLLAEIDGEDPYDD